MRSPAAARLLAAGAIVAVKGLGGYHLAVRADDAAAVQALRARKRREDRPFALMVADLAGGAPACVRRGGGGGTARELTRGRSFSRAADRGRRSLRRSPRARSSSA